MIKLAVTGNLGTGKTTVCKIFERLGVPVYYADLEAKRLMQESEGLKKQIQSTFGADTYENGILQAKILAAIVFRDEEALKQLNALVHPVVNEDMKQWFHDQKKQNYSVAIEEAALTFEADHQDDFDKIITVVAPLQRILERAMKRDRVTKEDVTARLRKQMPQMDKALRSDGIILNDEYHSLIFQVYNLIKRWDLEIDLPKT